MAERGLTAILAGVDVSVVAYNLFRMLFILLVMPIFHRRWPGEERMS